jgi:hypothetical protein
MPRVLKIENLGAMADRRAFLVRVQYPDEKPTSVTFTGPSQNIVGPVVMVTAQGQQVPVHDPGRFGPFGREWIYGFFDTSRGHKIPKLKRARQRANFGKPV